MSELQEALHKFERVAEDLRRMKVDHGDPNSISIALGLAKRVRRESTVLVRELARTRDNLHSQEADNKS